MNAPRRRQGRPPATGRFDTREALELAVIRRDRLPTTRSLSAANIGRACRVSEAVARAIMSRHVSTDLAVLEAAAREAGQRRGLS